MKKLLLAMLCVLTLTACKGGETVVPTPPPQESSAPNTVKTMITESQQSPIKDSWTTLGEIGVVVDGEYTDIILATEAQRGADGYMLWDDSQRWALVAKGDESIYTLFDENMSGTAYMEVSMKADLPSVKLITSSTMGLAVTEYTYSDGAFYAQKLVEPTADGNRIYSSFPEYFE